MINLDMPLERIILKKPTCTIENIKSNYDNSLSSKIVSDYFTLKKEHEKANIHLRRALVLMQIEETNKMK